MGRPATGPVSTFPHALKEAILHLRTLHPGWGPNTLVSCTQDRCLLGDQPLPSRAQIARLLKQAGLTRRYQPHHDLPQPPRVSPSTPHQEWQMDASSDHAGGRGGQGQSDHRCRCRESPKAESYPSLETTNPALPDYQLTDTPSVLHVWLTGDADADHGTVFYDNTTPSPFPTRLHLWLLALGVQVRFTRKRCPTDHANTLRTHQTMTAQALLGQTYPSHAADVGQAWMSVDRSSTTTCPVALSPTKRR